MKLFVKANKSLGEKKVKGGTLSWPSSTLDFNRRFGNYKSKHLSY